MVMSSCGLRMREGEKDAAWTVNENALLVVKESYATMLWNWC